MFKQYNFLYLLLILGLFLVSCENNDSDATATLPSGYILHTQTEGSTPINYVSFFSELPSGSVDNTQGKTFAAFLIRMALGNILLSDDNSGANQGLSKISINSNNEVVEEIKLPTIGFAAWGIIKDATTAYVDDRNDDNITIFNPTTMQTTGVIDMSNIFKAPQWTGLQYEGFVIRGNDLFVGTRPDDGSGDTYASDSSIYNHIDLTTNTYQKTIFFPGADLARRTTENWVDESGNIYIVTGGNITVPQTIRPTILKIPAGSTDFDPNYDFKYINAVGGAALTLPIQSGGAFNYYKNGKAYAIASTTFSPALATFLAQVGTDFSTWTAANFQQAFGILFTAANGQYVELDMNAQTATILTDIPATSPFNGRTFIVDDKVYCVVSTTNESALYEYDPATGNTQKVFDVTGGGTITGFFKTGN